MVAKSSRDNPLLSRRVAALSPEKQALLALRLGTKGSNAAIIPRRKQTGACCPLSFAQQRLWFLSKLENENAFYNIRQALRLTGQSSQTAFEQTLGEIVRRHETLRTSFGVIDGAGVQIISPLLRPEPKLVDLTGLLEAERESLGRVLASEESARPFELSECPLFRICILQLADGDAAVVTTMHHIISDGWSLGVLTGELTVLYDCFVEGSPSSLPPLPIQYADFAVWQREWLTGPVLEEEISYWKAKLSDMSVLRLPTDRARLEAQSYAGARFQFELPKYVAQRVAAIGQGHASTLFMTLLTAFQFLLCHYSGQEDIVVGTDVANRNRVETEGLIGFFINQLVIRGNVSRDPSFSEALARTRRAVLDAQAHQDLPFEKLVEELHPDRSLSMHPIFQVKLIFQNAPVGSLKMPGVRLGTVNIESGKSNFDLTLSLTGSEDRIFGSSEYSTDLFDTATIARMTGHFRNLLWQLSSDANLRLSKLDLLSPSETQQLVYDWNDTDFDLDGPDCLHRLFELQGKRSPDATALVFEEQQLTYNGLNRRANQLTRHLTRLGVGPETRVGLYLERSIDLVVSLVAVLKAGAAYVPLDATAPLERVTAILDDAVIGVVLTQERSSDRLPAGWAHVVEVDAQPFCNESEDPIRVAVNGDNAAYVIYTSGSAGLPKGVIIQHRSVVSTMSALGHLYRVEPGHRVLQFVSPGFDAFGEELYPTLSRGAALVMHPTPTELTPDQLTEIIQLLGITVLHIPPAYLIPLAQELSALPSGRLNSVALLITGGERLPLGPLISFENQRRAGLRVINSYGLTESSVTATVLEVQDFAVWGESRVACLPIGRPIANVHAYIPGRSEQPAPLGVTGELHIGGAGLARGYLNDPALTAEKFIPNWFASESGARLYRTGDLTRYLPDGRIEFIDRADRQVKVRGHRIELGEIEGALHGHNGVREAVVVSKSIQRTTNPPGGRLVAYVVPERRNGAPVPSVSELRGYLKRRLPEYMIPSLVFMERMPLTLAGKVDTAALPEIPAATQEETYLAPRDGVEETLCRIWAELLGAERVGVQDNFFELGGDSILSIQVATRASQAGLHVTTKQLFQHQTIAALAGVAGTAPRPEIDNGIVAGEVPLTPIQHWFFEQQPVDPHHYNQSVLLESRNRLVPSNLREVARSLVVHHDALRLQFHREPSGWRQTISPPFPEAPLFWLDLSALSRTAQRSAIEYVAASCQTAFDLSRSPLFRMVLFDLGLEQPQRLLIITHHLAVDGLSWRILLEDLERSYAQLVRGEAVQLPEKTSSFQQWSLGLTAQAQALDVNECVSYWVAELDRRVKPLPVDNNTGINSSASAEIVRANLTQEDTRGLLYQVPAAYRTHINDALLAGLVRAFAEWTGERTLLIDVEGHGRQDVVPGIDVTRTVGWFTSYFPIVLERGDRSDPAGTLKRVKELLRRPPRQGMEYALLRYLCEDDDAKNRLRRLPQAQVSFNYLGQFDQVLTAKSSLALATESTGPGQSPQRLRTHLLEVTGTIVGGQLRLALIYSANVHDRKTIQRLAQSYCESLHMLVTHCQSPEAGGCTPSDFPLARLSEQKLSQLLGTGCQVEDLYPLSPMQQGMLFHALYAPTAGVYVSQQTYTIAGDFDPDAFEQAWQKAVDRHTALRTSFLWTGLEKPLQAVDRKVRLTLQRYNWTGCAAAEQLERLQKFLENDLHRGLDLSHAPLIRLTAIQLSSDSYQLISLFHHLLADGWSWPIVLNDVFTAYEALRNGTQIELGPSQPYRNYIAWLSEQDLASAEEFWRSELRGFVAPTPLDLDSPDEASQRLKAEFGRQQLRLSVDMTTALHRLVRQHQLTLNGVMQGAWALLLSRYSGHAEVVFGVTVSGRPSTLPGSETMVGMFINTLPMRIHLSRRIPVASWLKQIQGRQAEISQYEFSPLVDIQNWSEVPRGTPLFESILIFEKYPIPVAQRRDRRQRNHLTVSEASVTEHTHYPLGLEIAGASEVILRIGYSRRRFSDAAIVRALRHFEQILEQFASRPEQSLATIGILTGPELHQLAEWNDTAAEFPGDRNFASAFERQVADTPDAISAASGNDQRSYRRLNEDANRIAAHLTVQGVGADAIVALFCRRSIEMLTSILALFKAGGVYMPLDPIAPARRLAQVLDQSQVGLIITGREYTEALAQAVGLMVSASIPRVLNLDELLVAASCPEGRPLARPGAHNLSYVIYTSGSTGTPKGVMIEHAGMLNHLNSKIRSLGLSLRDIVAQTASQAFDISIWQFLAVLLVGGRVHIFDDELARDAARLPEEIDRACITTFETVPSLLSAILDHDAKGGNHCPRLASLRWLVPTGEALPPQLCGRWITRFPHATLLNAYGPTECSDDVTHYCIAEEPLETVPRMSIGRPIDNLQIFVLDEGLSPVPPMIRAELCVAGVGLGRGYLNDPERTSEAFIPDPMTGRHGAKMYRTGDLARYLADGTIDFLGRLDHQVKLRGFRIELGEIEAALRQHSGLRDANVMRREDEAGNGRLVAYLVSSSDERPSTEELRKFLRARLPDYMIPSAFVWLASTPLTPTGKVDRRALPMPTHIDQVLETGHASAFNPIEEVLASIWTEVLHIGRVGIRDNFFELGGHSLLAVQVTSRVREAFDVELPLRTLFENPVLADLAIRVEAARLGGQRATLPRIEPVERHGPLRLSFAQQRLWFLDQYEPNSPFYNIPIALRLRGTINVGAMEQSLQEIVRRHEVLRTTFLSEGGIPSQVVHPPRAFMLPVGILTDLSELDRTRHAQLLGFEDARRAFNLSIGPLHRATLIRLFESDHVLLFTLHHIVSDGWSTGLFVREFTALYTAFKAGEPSLLPELPIQFADYASWQRQWLQGSVLDAQLAYWKRQLGEGSNSLQLPTDYPRPAIQSFRGAMLPFTVPTPVGQSLSALSRRESLTLFMTLVAAFQTQLHRYTGQAEINVGTPIAGRRQQETESLIGFFVNTLVLRAGFSGDPNFKTLLGQVREVTLEAYANQDVPFEKLVEELEPERSLSHSPLFQVLFVFENAPTESLDSGEFGFSPFQAESTTAKFDLTLFMSEREDGSLSGAIEYCTDLFKKSRMSRFVNHFQVLLAAVSADPEQPISALGLLTEAERHHLLMECNETERTQQPWQTTQDSFATQSRLTPDRVALVCATEHVTFYQLDDRAKQVAYYLHSLGVQPDVLVGISIDRSIEMVVGMLGVLMAGGAYLPLDPSYPADRLQFMLEDSRARVLITTQRLRERLPRCDCRVVYLDCDWDVIDRSWADNPRRNPLVLRDNIAYVIYTSGSTGRPKGIALAHWVLTNLIDWHLSVLSREARTLQFASLSFDASFHEIFAALGSGGTLLIATDTERMDPASLATLVSAESVEKLILPVVVLQQIGESYSHRPEFFRAVREIITTGEQLQITSAIVDFFERLDNCAVHNHYGPSETHVVTSYTLPSRPASWVPHPPIGRPISNTQIYVLDPHLALMPVGLVGELYIGGPLARGYVGRPEASAERFLPDSIGELPGARIYRTGDFARLSVDGNAEYLGRTDHQIKLRGFRIELREIEAVLSLHQSVRENIVIVREDEPGNKRLVAYLVTEGGGRCMEDLRSLIKTRLPDYMIPSAFVLLEQLPLTPNGKVDRRRLPAPDRAANLAKPNFVAPRTAAEALVAATFIEVLKVERVGVYDNFFDLGGHSLLATQVISRLREKFQVELLPLRRLFEAPTVAGFVEALTQVWGGTEIVEQIAQTWLEVDRLSPDQLESALSEA